MHCPGMSLLCDTTDVLVHTAQAPLPVLLALLPQLDLLMLLPWRCGGQASSRKDLDDPLPQPATCWDVHA